ncbi:tRNA (guanosine(46)-N7)-methyltransferase TrmB [Lachnospiraceae bacterium 46-15]
MRLRNIPGADEAVGNSRWVVQEPEAWKGKWGEIFGNDNPVHIEVGMGKGQFVTEMALRYPNINYVGIERYTSVLLRALQKREKMEEIPNLYYLCIDARDLPDIFAPDEVEKIYLNFSDPWPKDRHAKRRLPSREFLRRYDKILKESGKVEFKTDNRGLFEFALEEVKESGWELEACTFDLHHNEEMMQGNVMTEYEEKFSEKGNPIHKMIISRKKRCVEMQP